MDIDELKRKAHKESFEDAFLRHVLRNISIRITKYLVMTRITPNHITILSFIMGILAALCFAARDYTYLLVGAVLFLLSAILDLVDGEVARVKSLQSLIGAWLDPVLDMVKTGMLFLGIAFRFRTDTNQVFVWVTSYLAFFGLVVENFSGSKQIEVYGKGYVSKVTKVSKSGVLKKLYENLYGFGSITLLLLIGAVLNQLVVPLILLAFASNLSWISKFVWVNRKSKRVTSTETSLNSVTSH